MCGIAGIVNTDLPAPEVEGCLRRMIASIRHRGPDGEGYAVFPHERAGLAACRLSLVDIAHGDQPFTNEDGSAHVVFNGEIYNHRALRTALARSGHIFRSSCDTEVLVHLYEERGDEFLNDIDGMFGLAVFDRGRNRLLLARDGPGMKPLYVADTPRGFLFASEVKALFASGLVEARPDPASIDAYLALGFFPAPCTGFAGIEKMHPGECLTVEAGRVMRTRFWHYRCREEEPRRPDEQYADDLDARLRAAVRTHLAADVPVGALVSGGWDSSLVATLAAQESGKRLQTFSIVFPGSPLDESRYSRVVARHIGSDHHEIEFYHSQVPDLLRRTVWYMEEPVTSGPSVLFHVVSSLASRHVKGVLSGEGADELFGGYSWFRTATRRTMRSVSRRWRGRLKNLLHSWSAPSAASDSALRRQRAWNFGAGATRRHTGRLRPLTPAQRARVLCPALRTDGSGVKLLSRETAGLAACRDRLQKQLALEFSGRLPYRTLLPGDKLGMAHGLEFRMPFLDRSIVSFAGSLPADMKIRGDRRKYVLSHLARRYLPSEIAGRRKKGLAISHAVLRAGPLARTLGDMLMDGAGRGGPFDRRFLEAEYYRWLQPGQPLFRRPLLLVFLQVWWDAFLRGLRP